MNNRFTVWSYFKARWSHLLFLALLMAFLVSVAVVCFVHGEILAGGFSLFLAICLATLPFMEYLLARILRLEDEAKKLEALAAEVCALRDLVTAERECTKQLEQQVKRLTSAPFYDHRGQQ